MSLRIRSCTKQRINNFNFCCHLNVRLTHAQLADAFSLQIQGSHSLIKIWNYNLFANFGTPVHLIHLDRFQLQRVNNKIYYLLVNIDSFCD